MDASAECLALVRAQAHDRFLASLFAPDDKRPALLALYAFDIEISRIAGLVSEPMIGEIRLQWWRDTLESLARREAAAHPVAVELGKAMRDHRLPVEPFLDLVTAHEFDLYDSPMTDVTALEKFLGQTSSAVIQLASLILSGDAARSSAEAAGYAGVALGLASLIGRRAAGDRGAAKYFPAGLDDEAARGLALKRLRQARELAATVAREALPAFLPVALTELNLTGRVSPLRRQLRLWWSARRNRF